MGTLGFEAKSDRELLLLVAQQTNTTDEAIKAMDIKLNDVCRDHRTLKRNFYMLIAFMIGSGILGLGIWQLVI